MLMTCDDEAEMLVEGKPMFETWSMLAKWYRVRTPTRNVAMSGRSVSASCLLLTVVLRDLRLWRCVVTSGQQKTSTSF